MPAGLKTGESEGPGVPKDRCLDREGMLLATLPPKMALFDGQDLNHVYRVNFNRMDRNN